MKILGLQSLKTRVTLFTLAIFVLGMWALSFYANHKLKIDMTQRLGDRQSTVAALIAKQIDYDLEQRFEALQIVADDLGKIGLSSPSAVQEVIHNRPLLIRDFNAGAYITRLDGTTIATIPAAINRLGVNYIDRDYISTAIHQGKRTVGRPVISKVFNAPIIGMGVPIKDQKGINIGAIAGVINLDKINFLDSVTASRFGRTGYFVLQDKKSRTIVTSSGKKRILEQQPQPGVNRLIDRHLAGYDETGITVNAHGIEVLASSKSIPIADWSIVVALPTSEAFAPIRDLNRHIIFATVLMTILAAGLTWWMLRRELFPMFLTVKNLADLAKSEQIIQLKLQPVSMQNEIGELISGFNHLLEKISRQSEDLKQNEFRWKFALEGTGDGLWDWDIPKREVFFSKNWKEMLGYSETEIGNGFDEWEKRVHPEDRERVLKVLQAHLDGKSPTYFCEYRLLCKNGSYKWILVRGLVVNRDVAGNPLRMIGMHSDISERKFQEEYKNLRNRIMEMLANGEAMEQTLLAILTGIEHMYPEMLCSILLLDSEGKRLVNCIAPSLPDFYNKAINGLEIGAGQGSCGTAAFTAQRVIVEDTTTHPYWAKFRDVITRAGLGACWSQPIFSENHDVLGTFAIYHRDKHTPTLADIILIEETAQLASIAINKHIAEYNQRIAATAFETSKGMLITDHNQGHPARQ